ncbi:DUF3017 domain-containing protein [Kibdelosporangium phytohabitans]|uniref:DUF3017 domain-containing protein n=1 Tax=Kibdelosporangium phytohabitans TaxID=860235 RepID=A0A0N9IBE6_9PSEU|nr:DUF3017 domain-containing protein [Kibdelosporangium phytohabitans]ALG13752.1 hypothetical protein AOZ06_48965 [Kibdelosporangium phytohabitans]MBE1467339.1 hypothetical protein [Kibdelosporangium phytohabitans]
MTVVPSKSRLREQWPFAVVLLIVVVGLVLVLLYHWRKGTSLVGGALLVAAALRLLLPDSKAGLLAVRKRRVDILLYGGIGLMILYISASIIGGPLN